MECRRGTYISNMAELSLSATDTVSTGPVQKREGYQSLIMLINNNGNDNDNNHRINLVKFGWRRCVANLSSVSSVKLTLSLSQ